MADKVGSVYIEIQAKMGSLEKDLKSLEDKLNNTSRKSKDASFSFSEMGKTIAGLGVTGAIVGLGTAVLKATAQMQQNKVAFTTMLGSADKANKLLQDMTKFAAETPFQLPEIVDAGKKLLAFGFSAESIIPTLTKLGDISAALNIPVGELSDLYGKARVQGTLYAEDLNQLAGRGIPIFTELGKVMNVDASQIKKLGSEGKITFDKLESAITNMTKSGSQFGGMMSEQAKTLAGQWSTFLDTATAIGVEFGTSLLPDMTRLLQDVSQTVTVFKNLGELIPGLGGLISASFKPLQWTLETINAIGEAFELDKSNLENLIETEKELTGQLEKEQATKKDPRVIAALNEELRITKERIKALDQTGFKIQTINTMVKDHFANIQAIINPTGAVADKAAKAAANWAKMVSEAKKFNEEVQKQADQTDDPVLKVQQELNAIIEGYQRNKDLKSQGLIDESQYNLNVLNITEARIKKEEELEAAKFEKLAGMYNSVSGVALGFSSQLAQLSQMAASNQTAEIDNRLTKEQEALQAQYDMNVEAINSETISQEEKNLKLKALDEQKARDEKALTDKAAKEKRKIAHEAAKQQKMLAMFDTIIATPTAAFQAYKALSGIPVVGPGLGLAAAAATTALGLAKLKLISEQPLPALAQGGIVPAVPGGNQFTIGEAGSAEAVIPLNDNTLGKLAGMINNAGGGSQSMNITLNVDGETFGSWLYKATKNGQATISSNGLVA